MSKYQALADRAHRATIRTSSARSATATRSSASCASRCRISRSAGRGRGSSGASRCPSTTSYVTYVWFDALINYVSALGDPDDEQLRGALAARPAPDRQGHPQAPRDLLAVHAEGGRPRRSTAHLNVHGYWSIGGGKMSKSLGNVVEALALTEKYGNDAFRYFVLREMTFGLDADFSEEAFVDAAQRRPRQRPRQPRVARDHADRQLRRRRGAPGPADRRAEEIAPAAAAAEARAAVERGDGRVRVPAGAGRHLGVHRRASTATWTRRSRGRWPRIRPSAPRLDARAVHARRRRCGCLGIVLDPFLPEAAAQDPRRRSAPAGAPRLADAALGPPRPPVPRVHEALRPLPSRGRQEASADPAARAADRPPASEPTPPRIIPIADFRKVDLRVAEVLAAEAVPKSKKLLKLTVSLGEETRTVVAGIAEHYAPGDLVGKKVVSWPTCEPAKLMGVESNGMVLAGSSESTLGAAHARQGSSLRAPRSSRCGPSSARRPASSPPISTSSP